MSDVGQEGALAGIPRPGEVLVGKYRVERVLGVGGMGAVVAATHLHLDEKVAIKFLHADMAQNAEVVARFLREGKSVIKIRSEHAVKVHDVGKLENGAPYLVMEHLDGDDLSTILEKNGPLRPGDAVDMILQASEAIAEAHSLGIVHRDLKPANLFLTRRADGSPSVKVLDFGISKANSPNGQDMAMTKTQAVMGSPRYMSPEQMRSTRNVDARTDLWALGVILHELLSGAPPFKGESMPELCAQILQDMPSPLGSLRPDVPPALDAAIQRCLAKNPDHRYTNLAGLAVALAEFGSASAKNSAERIVRVMQPKGAPSGSFGNAAAPVAAIPSFATNPTVAHASPRAVTLNESVPGVGTATGTGTARGVGWGLALAGAGVLVIGGAVVGAVLFARHGSSPALNAPAVTAGNATAVVATSIPIAPVLDAAVFQVPAVSVNAPSIQAAAALTMTPTSTASAASLAPTPHRHGTPAPTAAAPTGGAFDGRR